jgi:hypothetical protein
MEVLRNSYKTPVGKPEGKRPLDRSSHRWEYNIKIVLSEIGQSQTFMTVVMKGSVRIGNFLTI